MKYYHYNGSVHKGEFLLPTTNRSFRYGDAIFETIKLSQGYPLFYRSHYSRLVRGLDAIGVTIQENFTFLYLFNAIQELAKESQIHNGVVRIQAWRRGKGTYTSEQNNFDFLIELIQPSDEAFFSFSSDEYHLGICKAITKNYNVVSAYKTANALPYVIASNEAKEQNADNAILLNDKGHVVETVAENIFIYSTGVVKTPPVEDGCVDGIMRSTLKKLLKWNAIELKEESITVKDIEQAQEIFLTNSIKGIIPVSHFKDKRYFESFSKGLHFKLNERISQILERNKQ